MGSHDPSAAQFLGLPVEILLIVAKAGENLLRLGLDLGIAKGGVLGGGFAVLRRIHGTGLFQFMELFFKGRYLPGASCCHIEDSLLAGCLPLLGEVSDHCPFVPLDGARIRLILLEQE